MTIEEIVRKYANNPIRQQWQIPHKAFNKCKKASTGLFNHLVAKGFEPTLIQLVDYNGIVHQPHPRWLKIPRYDWIHYVVFIDGHSYDLTARQFNSNANYPEILTKKQLIQTWRYNYLVAGKQIGAKK